MLPILGRYGPFFLYSYTVVMGGGLLLGLALAYRLAPQPKSVALWLDPLLVGLAAGILGGRLLYVLANRAYFLANRAEIVQLWRGGLSAHGFLLAALPAAWWWCRRRGPLFRSFAGTLALLLPLGQAAGWLACYAEGCGYGRESGPGWLVGDLPDSYGLFALRYQSQLLGLVLALAALGLLWWQRRKRPPLLLFWLSLALTGLALAIVTLFRGDAGIYLAGLRLDTWLSLLMAAFSLAGMVLARDATD